jgi:hypothetical protein
MHIAPYPDTVVIVSLDFDRDVVEQKYASVFSSPGIYASISESKRGFGYLDGKVTCETPTHTAYPSWYSRTELDRIIIHDDDSYDRKEREKDWAISLSCMTRIGGCSDARSIMPLALPLSATSDTSQRELKFADGCK